MQAKKGEHPLGSAGQLILMALFMAVWLVDSFCLHAETVLNGSVHWGIRLGILTATVTLAAMLYRSGRAAVAAGQRPAVVLKNGAFSLVRHPLYLATLLVYLGLSLATLSVPALAVTALIFLFFNHIAAFEERVMEEIFADEYRLYISKTGRWLPRLRRKMVKAAKNQKRKEQDEPS